MADNEVTVSTSLLLQRLLEANERIKTLEQEVVFQKGLNHILKEGMKRQLPHKPSEPPSPSAAALPASTSTSGYQGSDAATTAAHVSPLRSSGDSAAAADSGSLPSSQSRKRPRDETRQLVEPKIEQTEHYGPPTPPELRPELRGGFTDFTLPHEPQLLPAEKRRKLEESSNSESKSDKYTPVFAGPETKVVSASSVSERPPTGALPFYSFPSRLTDAKNEESGIGATVALSTVFQEWQEVKHKILHDPRFVPTDESRIVEVKMRIIPPKHKLEGFLALHNITALAKRMDDGTDLIQCRSEQEAKKVLSIFDAERKKENALVIAARMSEGVPNRALIALAAVKVSFEAYCKLDFKFTNEDIPAIKAMVERYFEVKYVSLFHGETFYVTLRRERKAEECVLFISDDCQG